MSNPFVSVVIDGTIGLAVIVGGIVLLALGKIDSPTGIAVIGAGAAIAKGSTTSAIALKVPAPGQPVVPPAQPPVA